MKQKNHIQIGLRLWRIGIFLYGRQYLQYNSWFIVPGVSIDWINGYDCYLDIEVKLLFIGFGVRFIWLKNWVPKFPLRKIFGRGK